MGVFCDVSFFWTPLQYMLVISLQHIACVTINQSMKLDIVPLQDIYSEALPAQPRLKRIVFREV